MKEAKKSDSTKSRDAIGVEFMLCDGERGSGPKGADDLCSVIFEELGLNVSINNGI